VENWHSPDLVNPLTDILLSNLFAVFCEEVIPCQVTQWAKPYPFRM